MTKAPDKAGTPTGPRSAAQRKADERQRLKDAGKVAVTVWIDPADRENLARYVKRLNQRRERKDDE